MPEKQVNEIPRQWREQYEKGKLAFERNNLDYAVTLLQQVLKQEPAFYACREALRATQFKKAAGGTKLFKKILGSASAPSNLAKGQIALRTNATEALNIAEYVLNNDPNSAAAHKLLAEAAMKSDLPNTAVLSLEIAQRNNPDNKDICLRLGAAHIAAGRASKAEKLLTDLVRSYPNDPDVIQALKDAAAKRTLSEGGYDELENGHGSYRDILKDKEETISLEQEKREVKTVEVAERLIQQNFTRLEAEPENLKLIRSTAELYLQKEDYDQALRLFQKITDTEGAADASLLKIVAETAVKRFDQRIAELDQDAPDFEEQSKKLLEEKENYIFGECQGRAQQYPNDLHVRYELGEHFFKRAKITEAIQEFQKAQANPHMRIKALHYLGKCFSHRGMNDLAAKTLQNAIKEKEVLDDEKKELLYSLGCVYEQMEKGEDAIEQFKQIYEVDIGFKDVMAKVDAFYSNAA